MGKEVGNLPQMSPAHYRSYVGIPAHYDLIGAQVFGLLIKLGLRENHTLLDVGCGSLRVGRLLIPYLLSGHYFGVEPNKWLVEAALENELGYDILRVKRPTLEYFDDFGLSRFGQEFDFILAHSIFTHTDQEQARILVREVAASLGSRGLCLASYIQATDNNERRGWVYGDTVGYLSTFFIGLAGESGLDWNILSDRYIETQTWMTFSKKGG